MKHFTLILIVCFLATACSGQINNEKWEQLTFDDAGFKAEMPCKPAKNVQEYTYSVGKRFGYNFNCEWSSRKFELTFGDHNPETGESVQKFLEYSKGDIEIAFKAFIASKEDTLIDGLPARQYVMNPGGGRFLITVVTANKKGILHATIGPVAGPTLSNEDQKLFQRLVNSIHFLSK